MDCQYTNREVELYTDCQYTFREYQSSIWTVSTPVDSSLKFYMDFQYTIREQ